MLYIYMYMNTYNGKLALTVTGLSHVPILTRPLKSFLFTCLFSKVSSSFNSMYVLRPPSTT